MATLKIKPGEVDVPPQVAKCPECGERLLVDVNEWEDATGKPADAGITLWCVAEWNAEVLGTWDPNHRCTQDIWQPAIDRVRRWARRRLRVKREHQ